jgi:hypothetical protein
MKVTGSFVGAVQTSWRGVIEVPAILVWSPGFWRSKISWLLSIVTVTVVAVRTNACVQPTKIAEDLPASNASRRNWRSASERARSNVKASSLRPVIMSQKEVPGTICGHGEKASLPGGMMRGGVPSVIWSSKRVSIGGVARVLPDAGNRTCSGNTATTRTFPVLAGAPASPP